MEKKQDSQICKCGVGVSGQCGCSKHSWNTQVRDSNRHWAGLAPIDRPVRCAMTKDPSQDK
jgi:hypothetical protein